VIFNIRVGAFETLAVGFATLYGFDVWGTRSETMGYGLLCSFLVVALALARRFRDRSQRSASTTTASDAGVFEVLGFPIRPLFCFVILIAYVMALKPLGYGVATAVAIALLLNLFKIKGWKMLSLAAGLAAMCQLFFVELMQIPLPPTPFFLEKG